MNFIPIFNVVGWKGFKLVLYTLISMLSSHLWCLFREQKNTRHVLKDMVLTACQMSCFPWKRELITVSHWRCNHTSIILQQWKWGIRKLFHEIWKIFKLLYWKITAFGRDQFPLQPQMWQQEFKATFLYLWENIMDSLKKNS